MSGTNDQYLGLYITGLRNQHAVENQAIELLQRQVERLQNYPEMEARMRQHIEESQTQARRLEELLSHFDTSHSGFKDTMMSIMGNMAALAHTPAQDEVLKNTLANFAFEHYEMAAYTSLLTLADLANHAQARTALIASLNEEKQMAIWIGDHIEDTTRRYAERTARGEKAGL